VFAAAGAQRDAESDINSGWHLYDEHCASCHGRSGLGDGPAAVTFRGALPDLTRIAERNGGTFPLDVVTRVVDGRTAVPGHLRGEMPVWGAIFQRLEGGADKASRARIDAVVRYIETLQRAPTDE
jgi:mono/diheme cytochrome c family protein